MVGGLFPQGACYTSLHSEDFFAMPYLKKLVRLLFSAAEYIDRSVCHRQSGKESSLIVLEADDSLENSGYKSEQFSFSGQNTDLYCHVAVCSEGYADRHRLQVGTLADKGDKAARSVTVNSSALLVPHLLPAPLEREVKASFVLKNSPLQALKNSKIVIAASVTRHGSFSVQ